MKRLVSRHLLLACLLAGTAFSASAQTAGVAIQPTLQDPSAMDRSTRDVRDHGCLRETGSHITAAQNQHAVERARAQNESHTQVKCNGFGRAYTQDDLRTTGAVDTVDALRRLDPSIH